MNKRAEYEALLAVEKQAREIYHEASSAIWNFRQSCEHSIIKRDDSAVCEICDKHFGWYCPSSPNHACDYEQADGSYNEDECRYCGGPEERK